LLFNAFVFFELEKKFSHAEESKYFSKGKFEKKNSLLILKKLFFHKNSFGNFFKGNFFLLGKG